MENAKSANLAVAGLLLGAAGLVALNTSAGHADDPMFGFMHAAIGCLDKTMMEAQDNASGQYGQYLRNQNIACLGK